MFDCARYRFGGARILRKPLLYTRICRTAQANYLQIGAPLPQFASKENTCPESSSRLYWPEMLTRIHHDIGNHQIERTLRKKSQCLIHSVRNRDLNIIEIDQESRQTLCAVLVVFHD